jgi:hypothetical protein
MSKKLGSKELTTADELTSFWDRNGGTWLSSILATSESIGLGVHLDEYTDGIHIRFDGTVKPGKQRIVRHNFEEALADPKNWKN